MTIRFYLHHDWEWGIFKCKGARIGYLSINLGRLEIVIFHPMLTKWILGEAPTVREK
jgi:hypothetical protein